jgi:predicted component of type VI protein secretion system
MQFLMERLVNRSEPDMGQAPPFDPIAAVAEQIQRIVECRPYVAARGARVCDFGMPPIVDTGIGLLEHERYGERLLAAIARFEPRLRMPRLEWLVTGKAIRPYALVVHGSVQVEGEPNAFRFELPRPDDLA